MADLDGAVWLPPQFLTDDDLLMDFKNNVNNSNTISHKYFSRENDTGFYFPCESPNGIASFGPHSDLSSPVESLVGSTETESDEEDYIAELTRQMAHSTLYDSWKADSYLPSENNMPWARSGSPQSTLCTVIGGCGCKQGSSRGSPDCASRVSSRAAMNQNEAAWDLLCAAAGEVARMRMLEEASGFYHKRSFVAPPRKPGPVSASLQSPKSAAGFNSDQSQMSYQQLQAAHFQQLKQQQMMKLQSLGTWGQSKGASAQYQQQQSYQASRNRVRNGAGRPLGLSHTAWPTLQQSNQKQPQTWSRMRAVFLGNPGSKRECAGTGVFLPRTIGTPAETRKKPEYSAALLPDGVVQALSLNLEAMDSRSQTQPRFNGNFTSDYDAGLKQRNNAKMAQRGRNGTRPPTWISNEVLLPPDWTY